MLKVQVLESCDAFSGTYAQKPFVKKSVFSLKNECLLEEISEKTK